MMIMKILDHLLAGLPQAVEEEERKPFAYNREEEPTEYLGEYERDPECDYGYSKFTDYIGMDIYIPYCAIMVDVIEFPTGVTAQFFVDFVFYDHLVNNYKVFLGPNRIDISVLDKAEYDKEYFMYGKINSGGTLHVNIDDRGWRTRVR